METMDVEVQEVQVSAAEAAVLAEVLKLLRTFQAEHASDAVSQSAPKSLVTGSNTKH